MTHMSAPLSWLLLMLLFSLIFMMFNAVNYYSFNYNIKSYKKSKKIVIITQLLLLLESAVAIIQSYVFAVLSTLYSSEVN